MTDSLPAGIPSIEDYMRLLGSSRFSKLEALSDRFIDQHTALLQRYAEKWVSDPLHQWSRQWEYPFVLEQLLRYASAKKELPLKILDAGSGLTFFPYSIDRYVANAEVDCCDYDQSLVELHQQLKNFVKSGPTFKRVSLDNTGYDDDAFDFIYCISVMEHTDNYAAIVSEFDRILKPGGELVVTFDISIDGRGDISPTRAALLCKELETRFEHREPLNIAFDANMLTGKIVTTNYASQLDASLLPWKRKPKWGRQIRSLLRHGRIISWPPPYTFCCFSMQTRKYVPVKSYDT